MTLEQVEAILLAQQYVADRPVAMAVHLAMRLGKPLLLEGQTGIGKTELAKVLATALGSELIRLQCYEGLDASTALYEWNFPKQVLRIRLEENSGKSAEEKESLIFSRSFLLERPLLRALTRPDKPPVLLIDEVDRSDEEFEALLLEFLREVQMTIPELGTIKAEQRPIVILTSNRTRELGDALRRRCLYLWMDYPTMERELAIVRARVPGVDEKLAFAAVRLVQRVRDLELEKAPGVAETLEWLQGLLVLGATELTPDLVQQTLGLLVKSREDLLRIRGGTLENLLEGI